MLERLTGLFEEQGKLNDREAFFKDVMWRERRGSDRHWHGCRHPARQNRRASTRRRWQSARPKQPIEWESLDGEPVSIVILFAVTMGDSDVVHLKLLQHVAMLLAHESFVDKLHAVKSPEEMLALLESSPDDYDD